MESHIRDQNCHARLFSFSHLTRRCSTATTHPFVSDIPTQIRSLQVSGGRRCFLHSLYKRSEAIPPGNRAPIFRAHPRTRAAVGLFCATRWGIRRRKQSAQDLDGYSHSFPWHKIPPILLSVRKVRFQNHANSDDIML